jgi:archaellum component FlaG (FlaF/FlaG flagellin family)
VTHRKTIEIPIENIDDISAMRYKEHDIVIEPNEITFAHVTLNGSYRQTIHVKNVGSKSKRIVIFRPSSKVNVC